jgi:RNA polymerase sigma-70 factor (ECF subfamily)
VRRRGYSVDHAEDLTQGFFAKLLEKNYVAQASRERGRFRTFLLSSFKNYMANEWDRTQAQKRGGGQQILSLDVDSAEQRLKSEPAETTTPEDLFARQWAQTLIERVLDQLRAEMEAAGGGDRFRRMKGLLTGSEEVAPYGQLAGELGMTESAVKVAVHRMRRRFAKLLRAEVAQTVESEEAVTDEIRFLIEAIGS